MATINHNVTCKGNLHHSINKIVQVRWGDIIGDVTKQTDLMDFIESILINYPTYEDFHHSLNNKVDKIEGYGLSQNDFTDVLKGLYNNAVILSHNHQNKAVLDEINGFKTINGETILGEGNIEIKGGGDKPEGGWKKDDLSTDVQHSLDSANSAVQPEEGKGLFSGNYYDLNDIPFIPSATSELINDSLFISTMEGDDRYQPLGDYPTREEVEALITPTTPNIIKFGDIVISDGQMSNFTSTNYAQFPFLVDLTDKVFEIVMEVTTSTDVTTQQNILDSQDGLAFAIRNGQLVLAVSNNGTSWTFEAVGGTILPYTTYQIKLGWDKSVYTVSYSKDNGKTWINAITQSSTLSPYPRTMIIGKDTTNRYKFKGSINLNKCTLSINGQYVWDGMTDAGLLTRLDTSLSNIDANGNEYINGLIDNKIGDIDNALKEILGDE